MTEPAEAKKEKASETRTRIKEEAQKLKYKGKTYYLYKNTIYDAALNVIIEDASNGFLDLYEYFEYFPQNK